MFCDGFLQPPSSVWSTTGIIFREAVVWEPFPGQWIWPGCCVGGLVLCLRLVAWVSVELSCREGWLTVFWVWMSSASFHLSREAFLACPMMKRLANR